MRDRAIRSVFLLAQRELVTVKEAVAVLVELGEPFGGATLAGKELVLGEFPVVVGVEFLELIDWQFAMVASCAVDGPCIGDSCAQAEGQQSGDDSDWFHGFMDCWIPLRNSALNSAAPAGGEEES